MVDIGPVQLLATAPWWLLQIRPNTLKPTDEMAAIFLKYLRRFVQILEVEEERMPSDQHKGFSALVKRS